MRILCILLLLGGVAHADDEDEDGFPDVQLHGFAGEGGFVSTSNDYFGIPGHASLEMFEAGLNVSTEPADKLRFGLQLYSRTVGSLKEASPKLDFAYGDYEWKPWLGLRAGIVKMPFGLYNEYVDIDAARTSILLPQSVYPFRDRDILISQTGFAAYGERELGAGGSLEYQAWLGTMTIPENAFVVVGAKLDEADTRYVTGAQLFWDTPVEGLRVGATYLRASIDFRFTFEDDYVAQLIAAGLVPPDFTGRLRLSERPIQLGIASAEYAHDDWLFAAEYSRWWAHVTSSISDVLPDAELDEERFYGMATRRLSDQLEVGAYYSVHHLDPADRTGDDPKYAKPYLAWSRDLAASLRYDVNDHWLWKVEGHFIDGAADLPAKYNEDPERYWGLFLFKTTVWF